MALNKKGPLSRKKVQLQVEDGTNTPDLVRQRRSVSANKEGAKPPVFTPSKPQRVGQHRNMPVEGIPEESASGVYHEVLEAYEEGYAEAPPTPLTGWQMDAIQHALDGDEGYDSCIID
jgi:hypothetical protein